MSTVTYTLTANCTQTGPLLVGADVSLTIAGGDFSIDATSMNDWIISGQCTSTINISNVTLIGGGRKNTVPAVSTAGDSVFANVTFRNSIRSAFSANACEAGKTHTFSKMLFENSDGVYRHFEEAGSAINVLNGAIMTITDLVVRQQYGGNAAVNAWLGGSITITGCFSHDRVFPQNLGIGIAPSPGSITDNSSGACSGTIGNDDDAVDTVAAPTPAACGLPAGGYLEKSATYYLNGDCQQTGTLYIPRGIDITIYGNGHTITAPSGLLAIENAGDLKLYNARLTTSPSNRFLANYLPDDSLLLQDVIITGNDYAVELLDTRATLNRVKLENNTRTSTSSSAASALRIVRQSVVTIRDSEFRNNGGGTGAVYIGWRFSRHNAPSLTLEGCVTWDSNTPANIAGDAALYSDNTTGDCGTFTFPVPITRPPQPRSPASDRTARPRIPATDGCETTEAVEALPLGAAACIFRARKGGDTVTQIYEIDQETSKGFHKLTVAQSQIDSLTGENIVAVSTDGRALVVVWPDDNVTVKFGPNLEGKILHITFDAGLQGRVIDMRTTYGSAPGLPYLGRALPHRLDRANPAPILQQFRAFGACMVQAETYLNFRESPGGTVIGYVSKHWTLTAVARTDGWFKVDRFGQTGWISADHVRTEGDCG